MSESQPVQVGPAPMWVRVVASIIVCLLLLGMTAGVLASIYMSEPTAQREGATRKSAALVEVVQVSRGQYRPEIVVLGHVEPARDIILSPRIQGMVTGLDPAFVPGGVVDEGQPLVKLDPADFDIAVAMRQSELEQAKSDLAIEKGRRAVAQQEFQLLDERVKPENRALVLREPQIASTQARVDAAEAALRRARLDLERATINAPFDAKILRRTVNVGSQVSPGDELARLVGVHEYWVIATVPLRHLRWVAFAEDGSGGSAAKVRHSTAWPEGVYRHGVAGRMIGTVDQQTRLARVLITVQDPLSRQTDAPRLILGSIMQVRIEGRPIPDVVRLSRDYLRENDTVWVMAEQKLDIRTVKVIFQDAKHVYIRDGLADGDLVVTTNLSTIAEGIDLKRADQVDDSATPTPTEGPRDEQ